MSKKNSMTDISKLSKKQRQIAVCVHSSIVSEVDLSVVSDSFLVFDEAEDITAYVKDNHIGMGASLLVDGIVFTQQDNLQVDEMSNLVTETRQMGINVIFFGSITDEVGNVWSSMTSLAEHRHILWRDLS